MGGRAEHTGIGRHTVSLNSMEEERDGMDGPERSLGSNPRTSISS